uniref:Uncharacterized protein n=1 Tax=Cacopsylla melanoneura TaxID=428564 RepID=A0A8D8M759_9HEMI
MLAKRSRMRRPPAISPSILHYFMGRCLPKYNYYTKLKKTQNILLRIILKKPRLFHTEDLYQILDVPNLVDIYIYKTSLYACKYSNDWTRTQTITRRTGLIRIEQVNKSLYKRHFEYIGKKLYNILPLEIKNEETILRLKNLIKIWLGEKHHHNFVQEHLVTT